MRRLLHIDWRTWLAFTVAVLVVFVVVDRERTADKEAVTAAENAQLKTEGAQERKKLLRGQQIMQDRIDRLVEQNAELVRLFDDAGIRVPPGLVANDRVTRIEADDDDNDDDGDTIIVRPNNQPAPAAPRPTANPPDDDDGGTRLNLPKVPLPDEAGEATDTAKRIVDDLTGIELE